LGGAISPWLGCYLYDIMESYDSALILCGACVVLASVSYWIAAPRNIFGDGDIKIFVM
jgi:hypothetical protein